MYVLFIKTSSIFSLLDFGTGFTIKSRKQIYKDKD